MSQPLPCGREMPRWSVLPVQPVRSGRDRVDGRAARRQRHRLGGPPLEASASSCGLVLLIEWLAAEKPHDEPESMLYPHR